MKKTLALVMALALAAGSTAFAVDIHETGLNTQTLQVTVEVGCTYTVSIPADTVNFGTSANLKQTLEVTKASIDSHQNHHLTVTATSLNYSEGWRMKAQNSEDYLAYTITNGGDNTTAWIDLTADECKDLTTNAAKAKKELTFACDKTAAPVADTYTDTLTFTVECKEQ